MFSFFFSFVTRYSLLFHFILHDDYIIVCYKNRENNKSVFDDYLQCIRNTIYIYYIIMIITVCVIVYVLILCERLEIIKYDLSSHRNLENAEISGLIICHNRPNVFYFGFLIQDFTVSHLQYIVLLSFQYVIVQIFFQRFPIYSTVYNNQCIYNVCGQIS